MIAPVRRALAPVARLLGALAVLITGVSACRPDGDPPSSPPTVSPEARTPRPVPERVSFPSGDRLLGGYLFRPAGPGPFPAVIFNHGSEQDPETKLGQALFYVKHGHVLFVPHRRGQGLSAAAGEYLDDVWKAGGRDPALFVRLLEAHTDDVAAALAYLRRQPFVDPQRLAVAGCSLGGIQSLLAAERGLGIRAAIDFAGAAITWAGNPLLRERMLRAARAARLPVFFLQAENDFDTTPSRALAAAMRAAGKPHRLHIAPPRGDSPAEGHAYCLGGQNPPWGPLVLAFLREHLPRRP